MLRSAIAILALAIFLGDVQTCLADEKTLLDEGRHIYRSATRSDGTAVPAVVQMDVSLPSSAAACSNCHRRSGFGISEGGSRSLNVTAPSMFAPTTKPPLRPAYDDATLARAIVAGIAADGRALDVTMPRYELSAADASALITYMRSLGASAPAGVTDTDIHIATIVSADAPEHERMAVQAVIRRFVEMKNGGSRREAERAAASSRHHYGRSRQIAHRNWKLFEWSLHGPESTWPRQLEKLYAQTTPFAVVSGTTGSGSPLIDKFCEDKELPCVLPLRNMPPTGKPGFYSLYFSPGVALEAAVTAQHIADSGLPKDSKILVINENSASGRAGLDALQSQLASHDYKNIGVYSTRPNKSPSARKWRKLLKSEDADILISWLPVSSMSNLVTESSDSSLLPEHVYTTQSVSGWAENTAPNDLLRERIRHVYPYSLPQAGLTQFPREDIWLKLQGLSDLDAVAAAKVLFACRTLGLALADIQSNFSREYLVETLEHSLDGTQLTSLYPRTTLGPDQRFLIHGAYVVRLSGNTDSLYGNPMWIQP